MSMGLSRQGSLYRVLRLGRNYSVIVRKRLNGVHPSASIHPSSHVARDLIAAEYSFVGRRCMLAPMVQIGRYTMLASMVAVVGDDHLWDVVGTPMQFTGRPPQRGTNIGADVWIGHGAIILRGATIGDGAIVAAGSVVTSDIPPFEVWAGVPARKLKDRFTPEDVDTHRLMLAGPVIPPTFASRQSGQMGADSA